MALKIDFTEVLKTWEPPLRDVVLNTKYMERLLWVTKKSYENMTVHPLKEDIFRAFRLTPYEDVRVVIVGQDPYPNKRASGLAFGNEEEFAQFKLSPSLEKIHSCIERTVYKGLKLDFDPTLVNWGQQGVLLLNSALTVEEGKVGSHSVRWRKFVRDVIKTINDNKSGVFFLFLGAVAKEFMPYVNPRTNYAYSYFHPAFACRQNIDWNCPYFNIINKEIAMQNGKEYCIKW